MSGADGVKMLRSADRVAASCSALPCGAMWRVCAVASRAGRKMRSALGSTPLDPSGGMGKLAFAPTLPGIQKKVSPYSYAPMSGAEPTVAGDPATGAAVLMKGPAIVFSAPASMRGLPTAGRKS